MNISLVGKFFIVIFIALLIFNILAIYDMFTIRSEGSGICAKLGCWWTGISVCYDWNGGRCFYPYTVIK